MEKLKTAENLFKSVLEHDSSGDFELVTKGGSLRVHLAVLGRFPRIISTIYSDSMNKGSGPYTRANRREAFISNAPNYDLQSADRRFQLSSIDVDLDFRVLVEIMRFVYTGKVEIDQNTNDSPGIATSLLAASDRYHLDQLHARCIEWFRLHASVEVFYALDFGLNARYIQNVVNNQEALSLLCDIFNQFGERILDCEEFPYVSFAFLKEIITRLPPTEHDEIRKLVYRWNAYDDHPVYEVEYLESLANRLTFSPDVSEYSSPISADCETIRFVIHYQSRLWNMKVGVSPAYLFDISPTIHTLISRVGHPESSEESFMTSTLPNRVEFSLQILLEGNHLSMNIYASSSLITSFDCEVMNQPVIFFAKSSMATFTVITL